VKSLDRVREGGGKERKGKKKKKKKKGVSSRGGNGAIWCRCLPTNLPTYRFVAKVGRRGGGEGRGGGKLLCSKQKKTIT